MVTQAPGVKCRLYSSKMRAAGKSGRLLYAPGRRILCDRCPCDGPPPAVDRECSTFPQGNMVCATGLEFPPNADGAPFDVFVPTLGTNKCNCAGFPTVARINLQSFPQAQSCTTNPPASPFECLEIQDVNDGYIGVSGVFDLDNCEFTETKTYIYKARYVLNITCLGPPSEHAGKCRVQFCLQICFAQESPAPDVTDVPGLFCHQTLRWTDLFPLPLSEYRLPFVDFPSFQGEADCDGQTADSCCWRSSNSCTGECDEGDTGCAAPTGSEVLVRYVGQT